VSTASVPPPGWVEPQRPAAPASPTPFSSPERPSGTDFANRIAVEDKRRLDTKRVQARIIDNLILLPVYLLALHQWHEIGIAWLLWALSHLIMSHLFEVTTGASPGKRLRRLRVADKDTGALPTPRQAAGRGVIGLFEGNLIGLLALHFSKGRTRIGDRAAGTVVVDSERHPIAARALTGGALVYPVLWAIPVALICWGATRAEAGPSYRAQADAVCRRAGTAMDAVGAGNGSADEMLAVYQQLQDGLAGLRPPADWADRHRALVARTTQFNTTLKTAWSAARASKTPKRTYDSYMPALAAESNADAAAARAAGYQVCGG
jgi:uncharacterized RDD family membrane protein YckC